MIGHPWAEVMAFSKIASRDMSPLKDALLGKENRILKYACDFWLFL